jgi:DNA-binding MarR family transcriptional regulator
MDRYHDLMTDIIPEEATVAAWIALNRAQRMAISAIDSEMKAAGFPPLSWYDALLELRRAPNQALRPVELEKRLLFAQHNVSRLIDRLEAAKLVERRPCPTDGRGQDITILLDGIELLARMWPVYRAGIQRHFGALLSEGAAGQLARLLQPVAQGGSGGTA